MFSNDYKTENSHLHTVVSWFVVHSRMATEMFSNDYKTENSHLHTVVSWFAKELKMSNNEV